jgi:hypothetical protein
VDLVRTDVSEERIAFIVRMKRIGDLGKIAVISKLAENETGVQRMERPRLVYFAAG